MSASPEKLRDLCSQTGFRAESLEKVIRLGEVLADVTAHPFLSQALALKGGTALNLAFGAPPRLSVDLDLNYVASVERADMLRDRPEVERAVDRIAAGRGYRVQRSADAHAGRKLFLLYRNAQGVADRIEVDLNFLFRLPLGSLRTVALWQPDDLARPKARVIPTQELVAGKLCALLDRAAPRDLFDVARLPVRLPDLLAQPSLRRTFVALAGILDHPLHAYGHERLAATDDQAVRHQLHPMLIAGDQPSAALLRERAWAVVSPLLDLDDAEREYTERLQVGELRPELLFPDDTAMAERVARHPALLWKARNAREHTAAVRRSVEKR
jgi:hypothetical protein